jgi:hypothetical protein
VIRSRSWKGSLKFGHLQQVPVEAAARRQDYTGAIVPALRSWPDAATSAGPRHRLVFGAQP